MEKSHAVTFLSSTGSLYTAYPKSDRLSLTHNTIDAKTSLEGLFESSDHKTIENRLTRLMQKSLSCASLRDKELDEFTQEQKILICCILGERNKIREYAENMTQFSKVKNTQQMNDIVFGGGLRYLQQVQVSLHKTSIKIKLHGSLNYEQPPKPYLGKKVSFVDWYILRAQPPLSPLSVQVSYNQPNAMVPKNCRDNFLKTYLQRKIKIGFIKDSDFVETERVINNKPQFTQLLRSLHDDACADEKMLTEKAERLESKKNQVINLEKVFQTEAMKYGRSLLEYVNARTPRPLRITIVRGGRNNSIDKQKLQPPPPPQHLLQYAPQPPSQPQQHQTSFYWNESCEGKQMNIIKLEETA